MIELMAIISIIAGLIALLVFYQGRGQKFYNKAFQFGRLQSDAHSALDQMVTNLREANRDYVYTGSGFHANVPLPDEALYDKPYIYFAKPNFVDREFNEEEDELSKIKESSKYGRKIVSYDYYLYYFKLVEKRDGDDVVIDYDSKTAKMKLQLIRHQSADYTKSKRGEWPFLPPIIAQGVNFLPEEEIDESVIRDLKKSKQAYIDAQKRVAKYRGDEYSEYYEAEFLSDPNTYEDRRKSAFVSHVESRSMELEFDRYSSNIFFDYEGGFSNLFKIKVNMLDELSNTRIRYETAVSPRN